MNYPDMANNALSGFASMSTDTGHESAIPDASWALNNPETQMDWGFRAMHVSVELGKMLAAKYYGTKVRYSYFSSCSTGGRQGLKAVQMFPEDFDGVVVAAPAWWTSRLQPWHVRVSLWNLPVEAAHHIPSSLFPLMAEEVIRQCDAQDGVVDGIVSSPETCIFSPEALLCKDKSRVGTCLTAAQLETWGKMFGDWFETNGTFVFPHLSLSSETEFGQVMNVRSNVPSPMGTTWLSNFLLNHSSSTASSFNWSANLDFKTVQLADSLNPGNANADQFDISAFAARGGKLIHYHGYSDGLIPATASIYLYKRILRTLIPQGISVPAFYKFYLVPGLRHCRGSVGDAPWYINGGGQAASLGGEGNVRSTPGYEDERHDVVKAVMRWVEEGIEPQEIVATKWKSDVVEKGVLRQRPVCPFPQQARWDGVSDVNREESWTCERLY